MNGIEKIKGLSRIDSEKNKTHGWYARVYGGDKTFSRFFSDYRYPSPADARKAAIAHLNHLTLEISEKFKDYIPGQSQPKYRKNPDKNNTSGTVGVHRSESVRREKRVSYWVATWSEAGKCRRKYFYIGDGLRTEAKAKRLAIEWRARKVRELERSS